MLTTAQILIGLIVLLAALFVAYHTLHRRDMIDHTKLMDKSESK